MVSKEQKKKLLRKAYKQTKKLSLNSPERKALQDKSKQYKRTSYYKNRSPILRGLRSKYAEAKGKLSKKMLDFRVDSSLQKKSSKNHLKPFTKNKKTVGNGIKIKTAPAKKMEQLKRHATMKSNGSPKKKRMKLAANVLSGREVSKNHFRCSSHSNFSTRLKKSAIKRNKNSSKVRQYLPSMSHALLILKRIKMSSMRRRHRIREKVSNVHIRLPESNDNIMLTTPNETVALDPFEAYMLKHKSEPPDPFKGIRVFEEAGSVRSYSNIQFDQCKVNPSFKKLSSFLNIRFKRHIFKLVKSKPKLINKIARFCKGSKASGTLKAQYLVKWCMVLRNQVISSFRKTYQSRIAKCQTYVDLLKANSSWKERSEIILGKSRHTSSTESYFSDSTYRCASDALPLPVVIDEKGHIRNTFPHLSRNKRGYSWQCGTLCNVQVKNSTQKVFKIINQLSRIKTEKRMVAFIEDMNVCDSVCPQMHIQGHTLSCRGTDGSGAPLVVLQNLAPHYSQLRALVAILLKLRRALRSIHVIDTALYKSDLPKLEELARKAKSCGGEFQLEGVVYECEDDIVDQFKSSFQAFTKKMNDLPVLYCFSCERLCSKEGSTGVALMKTDMSRNKIWLELIEYARSKNLDVSRVCQFCLSKIRIDQLPSVASLNKMEVRSPPDMILNLNDHEKIFIQRAKPCQVVIKMGTVSNKNMPANHKISKLVGRTFHLPLPIEETMKRVLGPTDVISRNQELYHIVRGIPTKQKIIWQNFVNFVILYESLQWFKIHNHLFFKIQLPKLATELVNCVDDTDMQFTQQSDLSEATEDPSKRLALLTQMNANDSFYDQFTIHPIQENRENKTGPELYQMRKIEDIPLNSREKELDLMCFPDLYPYGVNGLHENRSIPLEFTEYIKARMLSRHGQFRLNQQYIFYLLSQVNERQLAAGIYQVMNTSRVALTKVELLKKLQEGKLEGKLNNIFGRLRNTDQYWRVPRSKTYCMCDNFGAPTLFLTLSPADYDDEMLENFLREVNKGSAKADSKTLPALIAFDPVSVSRYLDHKFKAMLDFIKEPNGPLGIVEHYVWRREYQGRGTQHFHLILWIRGAPIIGKSPTDEIAKFVSGIIACGIPDKATCPELHKKVLKYQDHRHNSYCLRPKTAKGGGTISVCRFGFPRGVTDKFILRDVATSISGRHNLISKARLYDLPRKKTETHINDYNPAILMAWTGNCDIQFIGEKSGVLARYITKYQTKPELSHFDSIFDDINSTKSLQSRLWNVALRGLSNRECGALEAADTLMGMPLYGTDENTVIRWIDVRKDRNRRIKALQEIDSLDDSSDVAWPSFVDTHYPNRPEELEDLSLYNFAQNYDIIKVEPKSENVTYFKCPGNGFFRLRTKNPYLINHIYFDPKQKPDEYFYSMLLLFKPWRVCPADLLGTHENYAEAFDAVKDSLPDIIQYQFFEHWLSIFDF